MEMSVDTALQTVMTALAIPASPNVYKGSALEYVTTNYETIPAVYADSAPRAARYIVQVHYYLPHGQNPNAKLQQIAYKLWTNGFTWASVVNASDTDGQHYVLECEYVDGGGYYGGGST